MNGSRKRGTELTIHEQHASRQLTCSNSHPLRSGRSHDRETVVHGCHSNRTIRGSRVQFWNRPLFGSWQRLDGLVAAVGWFRGSATASWRRSLGLAARWVSWRRSNGINVRFSGPGTGCVFGRVVRYAVPAVVARHHRTRGNRDVAQLGSALDWGSRGRRFKSCRPDSGRVSAGHSLGSPLFIARHGCRVEHAAVGPLDSGRFRCHQLDLQKLTTGLSRTWAGYLRDWDRSLRAANYPATTRYNYLLAAAQLGRYLAEHSPDPDAAPRGRPAAVTRGHVEAFQAWMIETRSASTALNKHKGLQQFFKWLTRRRGSHRPQSPMDRVTQPKTPTAHPDHARGGHHATPGTCKGRLRQLRDKAIIRLYCTTPAPGCRRWATCSLDDVDLEHRNGRLPRQRRQGPTGTHRARRPPGRSAATCAPATNTRGPGCQTCGWPSEARTVDSNGIKILLKRRGTAAGVPTCTPTAGGTATPTNGSWPAATPET